jgi:N-acetyl-gamma-glutamyl-phosphate/LysW-gamma-L-alpha-aminoadipyl-6-phosphate reductase
MSASLGVGVVGASGYLGGELLRLLLGHPRVEITAAYSDHLAGRRVDGAHPNLRGLTGLTFTDFAATSASHELLFVATGHARSMALMPGLATRAKRVIDLSPAFRLRNPVDFERHYGYGHRMPADCGEFVTGLPELYRDQLAGADRISVPGCMATAATLALWPLATAGYIDGPVLVDGRVGSSGAGSDAGTQNLHPERNGAMRVFAPSGHRHEAEISQATGLSVRMCATGTPVVRGVQVLCHALLSAAVDARDVWRAFRERYAAEPFVRIIAERRGPHRLPDPKLLSGSNYCDVGFAVSDDGRLTAVAALDNLVKGGAGNAVQCLNVAMGWPERLGLEFPGLHPS